jgi:hypothetical protein
MKRCVLFFLLGCISTSYAIHKLPMLRTVVTQMANIFTLTPEQEFQHRVIQDQAAHLTAEDARNLVVELSLQLMVRNNVLIDLIRRKGV